MGSESWRNGSIGKHATHGVHISTNYDTQIRKYILQVSTFCDYTFYDEVRRLVDVVKILPCQHQFVLLRRSFWAKPVVQAVVTSTVGPRIHLGSLVVRQLRCSRRRICVVYGDSRINSAFGQPWNRKINKIMNSVFEMLKFIPIPNYILNPNNLLQLLCYIGMKNRGYQSQIKKGKVTPGVGKVSTSEIPRDSQISLDSPDARKGMSR